MRNDRTVSAPAMEHSRQPALGPEDYVGIAVLLGMLTSLLVRHTSPFNDANSTLVSMTAALAAIGGTVVAVGTTLAISVQSRLAQEMVSLS